MQHDIGMTQDKLTRCFAFAINHCVHEQWHGMMQEIAFFEEGEPMTDGEPGDLKVGNTIPMLCIAAMLQCFFVHEQQLGICSILNLA